MRLFVALDLDDAIRERIVTFVEGVRGFAPEARWTRPESLHITLKFIGEQPEEAAEGIEQTLKSLAISALEINFRGYGFFPTAKAARVFWAGINGGLELGALAKSVDASLAALGIAKEEHAFSPHLTLARGGSRKSGAPGRQKRDVPNSRFQNLLEKLTALPAPDFGTMTAREFYLYKSQLSPNGSVYTKLSSFALS